MDCAAKRQKLMTTHYAVKTVSSDKPGHGGKVSTTKKSLYDIIAYQKMKLNKVDEEEFAYRKIQHKVVTEVLYEKLHCTVCDVHIGYYPELDFTILRHPLLQVLCCSQCIVAYVTAFYLVTSKMQAQYCRWCARKAKVTSLIICSSCPFSFCEPCLRRNLEITEVINVNKWICPVCDMKQLWPLRGILSALLKLSNVEHGLFRDECGKQKDISQCCNIQKIEEADDILSFKDEEAVDLNSLNPQLMIVDEYRAQRRGIIFSGPSKSQSVQHIDQKLHKPSSSSLVNEKPLKAKIDEIRNFVSILHTKLGMLADSISDTNQNLCAKAVTTLLINGSYQINKFVKKI